VDDFVVRLDGATLLGGAPLDDGRSIDLLTELSLGLHQFRIEAVDALGNASAVVVEFEIVATPETLLEALDRAIAAGQVRSPGLSEALTAQLREGAERFARGQCQTAANVYQAFTNTLLAQQGKGIGSEIAAILITDAQFVAGSCQ
jgi:hypothetical protein